MPEKQDAHSRLYGYVVLLMLGLIVLVDGLSTLPSGWAAALIGAGLSAFGGFEVKFTYSRIQLENNSIQAKQTGKKSGQVNQTNPVGSTAIGKIDNAYFGTAPAPQVRVPEKETVNDSPWWVNRTIALDEFQEFGTDMSEGDEIIGEVESKD